MISLARFCSPLGSGCDGRIVDLIEVSQATGILQEGTWDVLLLSQNIIDIPVVALQLVITTRLLYDSAQSGRRLRILYHLSYAQLI